MRFYVPVIFGVMAVFFLVLGLRGIVTRKPFVISSRWILGLFILAFTPNVAMSLLWPSPSTGGAISLMRWFLMTMLAVLLVFLFLSVRGYVAFAVTDTSLREALVASLAKRHLEFEEKLGALRLPSLDADLQVAVQGWIGTGQLKMKQRRASRALGGIVAGVNEYFRENVVAAKLGVCVFYLIFGVLIGATAFVFSVSVR